MRAFLIVIIAAVFYLMGISAGKYSKKNKKEEIKVLQDPDYDLTIKFDEKFNAKVIVKNDFKDIINLYPDQSFIVTTEDFIVIIGKKFKEVIT